MARSIGKIMGTTAFQQRLQQNSIENSLIPNTDELVGKISATFPTVSETHIRCLLKKYLKGVFPTVEETLLLDMLATEDNNVMKAAEKLKTLGFERRDTPPPRLTLRKKEEEEALAVKKMEVEKEKLEIQKPTPPPRMKTLEEKGRMQARLQGLYSEVPERLIQIAMESAEYDEEKARHILMLQTYEEKENKPEGSKGLGSEDVGDGSSKKTLDGSDGKAALSRQMGAKKDGAQLKKDGTEKKIKSKKDVPKVSRGTSTTEDQEFKSPYLYKPDGRNVLLRKGPNDQLLLPDYMTWNGPNPELRLGHDKSLAKGANKSILSEKRFSAKGANKELRKGPLSGLAKGSIYSQMTGCVTGESRGQ
ncbi:UNVERIFIED_CONTAM: hypothetical protein PYX00_001624 [Menopon gallinae]|uniref:CUE domain-containing protein n=1 Tax=Menopon gallinae TaxID=328185 RepID=A0AAW2IDI7_9NEOP